MRSHGEGLVAGIHRLHAEHVAGHRPILPRPIRHRPIVKASGPFAMPNGLGSRYRSKVFRFLQE